MLAIIQAIINLPASIAAIWADINALKAQFASYQKAKEINSVVQTQKDTEAAKSDADFDKAAQENSADFRAL